MNSRNLYYLFMLSKSFQNITFENFLTFFSDSTDAV